MELDSYACYKEVLKGKNMIRKTALLLLISGPLFSVAYTWTGVPSSSWSNPSNWTPSGVPLTAADSALFSASSRTTVFVDVFPTVGLLGFDNTSYTFNGNPIIVQQGSTTPNGPFPYAFSNVGGVASTQVFSTQISLANNVTIIFGTQNIIFNAAITGAGLSLNVASGVITSAGINTYTGGTILGPSFAKPASFILTGTGVMASTGSVSFTSGDVGDVLTFDIVGMNAASQTIADLSSNLAAGGTATVNLAGKTLVVGTGNSTTYGGAITGSAGNLTKQNAGTLNLTGTSTYTGTTSISGSGGIAMKTGGVLSTSSGLSLTGTSFFDISQITAGSFTLGNLNGVSGTFLWLGNKTFTFGTGSSANFSGTIQNGGLGTGTGASLVKVGAGAQTLGGTNAFTGTTTITGGTISIAAAGALSSSSSISIGASGTLEGAGLFTLAVPIGLAAGSTVSVTAGNTMTLSGALTGVGGSLRKTNPGILTLTNAGNTYSAGTTITGGTISIGTAAPISSGAISIGAAGILQGTGTFTLANLISLGAGSTVDVTGANALTLSAVVSGAGGSLTKVSSGTLTLSNTG
ncbi:MAG TPA: autotransporter-associated beta strand repeat-containing protein, partial [Chlamydiales bacterium]|nr:autotransporter-associated beta strand repeat-containing protein [Chlamydiales bacterium]